MDLIYANEDGKAIGEMPPYEFDMAFGSDENDFELTVSLPDHCCVQGQRIYIDDADRTGNVIHTEYGGVIDTVRVETGNKTVIYGGRTWHGILAGKIISPDAGQDYLILSGDANTVLGTLIARCGLGNIFKASAESSGITINSYQMDRYIDAYSGIKKMLAKAGAKLILRYIDGHVVLSAVPLIDYSKDEEWDASDLDMQISKNNRPTNHIVCLGTGDLKDREVIHLYADADGNISRTQSLFGVDEVTEIYDYPNAESSDELIKGGTERLQEAYNKANTLEVNFDSNNDYDIGDIVGGTDRTTGVSASCEITKKIVKINKDGLSIECRIGE